jgi:preprotein translocase subunit SecE
VERGFESLPLRQKKFVNDLTKTLIWVGVVGAVFAFLWWQGQLQRLATYVQQTREELRKCTWPTWDELKGSTVVVTISIVLLGGFTMAVDQVLFLIFFKL